MWQCGDVSTSRRRLQGALVARSCYPLVTGARIRSLNPRARNVLTGQAVNNYRLLT
jgi:hypothetical protein